MHNTNIILVNEQDEIIGYKPRKLVLKEEIYRVPALWIKNSKGDILLAQRGFNKSHDPGKWGPAVAGTVEEGESYEDNIKKETEEEIGLTGIQFEKAMKVRRSGNHNYFTQWFLLVIDKKASDFTIQKEEVEAVKWFSREELQKELKEHPEKYLSGVKDYLDVFK